MPIRTQSYVDELTGGMEILAGVFELYLRQTGENVVWRARIADVAGVSLSEQAYRDSDYRHVDWEQDLADPGVFQSARVIRVVFKLPDEAMRIQGVNVISGQDHAYALPEPEISIGDVLGFGPEATRKWYEVTRRWLGGSIYQGLALEGVY